MHGSRVVALGDFMADRSLIAFGHAREGAQRFEYFLLGISVALCAYVGQTLQPQKFGWSPYTLEVFSVVLIALSVVAGFKRIEAMVLTSSLNHDVLDVQERRAKLLDDSKPLLHEFTEKLLAPSEREYALSEMTRVLPDRQQRLDAAVAKGHRYYKLRNWLLAVGFTGLFLAKILVPYCQTGASITR